MNACAPKSSMKHCYAQKSTPKAATRSIHNHVSSSETCPSCQLPKNSSKSTAGSYYLTQWSSVTAYASSSGYDCSPGTAPGALAARHRESSTSTWRFHFHRLEGKSKLINSRNLKTISNRAKQTNDNEKRARTEHIKDEKKLSIMRKTKEIKAKLSKSTSKSLARPRFSRLLLPASTKLLRPLLLLLLLCDQSDFILPNTIVRPFTSAPPKRCNLFSLSRLLILVIDWVGEELASRADSEFVEEFMDERPEKFFWKNAFGGEFLRWKCVLSASKWLWLTWKCVVVLGTSATAAAALVDPKRAL